MLLSPKTRLGTYEILGPLGAGGMGEVYRAFDQRLRREVAIKVLREDVVGHGQRRERVLEEARAAAPLNHPSVATVYEVGEQGDLVFIVMELIAGKTLRLAIDEQQSRPTAVARIGIEISEALAVAHDRHVVHGDIKPENIILQDAGGLKLLDFGVARRSVAETATRLISDAGRVGPAHEQLAGTLAYMAPELFRGAMADARSDLFSLGVLLYEMVSGHRPFPGPDATSLMMQILNQDAPRLESRDTASPPELARIIHKLLQKIPEYRYQTARDVKVDLANLERDLGLGPSLSAVMEGRRAVAVLPFKLLTPDPDDGYLRLALADSLINGLSASNQLLLRPSSSVLRYLGQHADPLLAARELNVSVIVDGSIQKLGPQLRVHVQAWSVDGSTLLSIKHDGEMSNLFGLQDEIAGSVCEALGVSAETAETPRTQNPQAHELFLRAVERLSHGNRWDTRTAIEMLRAVTALDPKFADAWARLGQACVMMAFAFEPESSWYQLADEAIERALALDSANVMARVAKGRVLWSPGKGFQNRPALQVLGEAIRLNPNSHQGLLWQSLIFLHVGLLEEAREGLTHALTMQPDDPFTLNFIGQALEFQGDYDAAKRYQDRTLALDPSFLYAHLDQPTLLVRMGELDSAERSIRTAEQLIGSDQVLTSTEALIWARRGEGEKAEELVGTTLKIAKSLAHAHHAWHNVADVYGLLGRPREAVEWLRKASGAGLPNYPLFRDDPFLSSIREDASFQGLMAELQLEWEGFRRDFV